MRIKVYVHKDSLPIQIFIFFLKGIRKFHADEQTLKTCSYYILFSYEKDDFKIIIYEILWYSYTMGYYSAIKEMSIYVKRHDEPKTHIAN